VSAEQWAIRITQVRDGRKLGSYWWQGPEYRGDHIMTRSEAERMAAVLERDGRPWLYEARLYPEAGPT
jgi:hypothetical protein